MFKMYKKKQHILLFLTTIFISLFFCHDSIALLDEGSDEGLNLVGSGFHSNAEEVDLEPTLVMKLSYKDGVITIKNILPNGKTLRMYKFKFQTNSYPYTNYKSLCKKSRLSSYEEYERLANAMSQYFSKKELAAVAGLIRPGPGYNVSLLDLKLPKMEKYHGLPYDNNNLTPALDLKLAKMEGDNELPYDNLMAMLKDYLIYLGIPKERWFDWLNSAIGIGDEFCIDPITLESGESISFDLREFERYYDYPIPGYFGYHIFLDKHNCSGKFFLYYNIDGKPFWNQENNLVEFYHTYYTVKNDKLRKNRSKLFVDNFPYDIAVDFLSSKFVATITSGVACIVIIYIYNCCTRAQQRPVGDESPFSRGG